MELPGIPDPPPGPQRASRVADKTGKIPFKSARAGIEGETAYWIWGDLSADKCPLIVLHGGPGGSHAYMTPLSLIADDYGMPVLMYDQVGCGGSTRFRDRKGDTELWTPELFVEELENVVAWLRKEYHVSQVDIIGQSWGGRLGALYAMDSQAAMLRKPIVSNSSTDLHGLHEDRIRGRKNAPEKFQRIWKRKDAGEDVSPEELQSAVVYEFGARACRARPWPQDLLDTMAAMTEDDTVYSTMLGFDMSGSLMAEPRDSLERRLPEITDKRCPGGMLCLYGKYEDRDQAMEKWVTLPKCKTRSIRFELSSHFVMFEEAEAYLKAIGDFLTDRA